MGEIEDRETLALAHDVTLIDVGGDCESFLLPCPWSEQWTLHRVGD